MPPTTIASSSSPPGDADLQELYNQVLSAFAEESSPSNFSPTLSPNTVDHDPPYSQHNDEPVSSYISTRPHTKSRGEPPHLSLSLHIPQFFSHKPPPALVTITVPSLLRQRIPPLLLRARAPALSQDFPAPLPRPPPLILPTCLKPVPSSMILTPRLLLGLSPQPSSACFPTLLSLNFHCVSLQTSTAVSSRKPGKRQRRTPCRAPSAARPTFRSTACKQNSRSTAPGEQ